jgi:hypothetical protein
MGNFFIVAGVVSLVYGIFSILGRTKNWAEDSELDKKLFSNHSRYLLGRYYAGFRFVVTGIGAILLGWIINHS